MAFLKACELHRQVVSLEEQPEAPVAALAASCCSVGSCQNIVVVAHYRVKHLQHKLADR